MESLFIKMRDAISRGEDMVLCSIIASSGSTPRGSGAKMVLFADGTTAGTVGGGAVEYESIKLAKKALKERREFTQGFNLSHNQTADIGMICGGSVVVYFRFFAGNDAKAIALFDYAAKLFSRRANAWLITRIDTGGVVAMDIYTEGEGMVFNSGIDESAILPLLKYRAMLKQGGTTYYVEPITRAGIVYVFGGGHVSQELVPVLSHIGFCVMVFEDREKFADKTLFPTAADTILGDFTDIGAKINVTENDYCVIMTRGHQNDFELLSQVLRTKASYIGVIGSRHKIASTNKRLIDMGIPESELARIHTPIGLEIGAETPAEIAISIAAELIAHRASITEEK